MNGDDFIKCVERSQKSLRRFLVSVCRGDTDLADDIAQESYIKAYLAKDSLKGSSSFSPWIMKIAYNTFLNYVRNNRVKIPIEELNKESSDDYADGTFRYETLYQALDSLSARERSAIILFYLEGYSTKEISEILDISDEAVRQSISRGRKRIKNLLD